MTEEKAEEFLDFMINLGDPERTLEDLPPDPFDGEHVYLFTKCSRKSTEGSGF